MDEEEKIEEAIDDIEEDHREEGESLEDAYNEGNSDKALNDVAEDHREEGESIEDLKQALKEALFENSMLKQKLKKNDIQKDKDRREFLQQERNNENSSRDYKSILKGTM